MEAFLADKIPSGSSSSKDVSSNILIKEIVGLGITWRSFDSVDIISQILVSPNIEVGYPYDFTTSEPAKANNGSHEIMLTYRLPVKGRSFPRCSF